MKNFFKRLVILLTPDFLLGLVYSMFSFSFFKYYRFKKNNCGHNSFIHPRAQLLGLNNITIGNNSLISEDCWLNVNFRSESGRSIIIGNNCHIGRRNFFSSGPIISIGDYSFTSLDCHFLGCGHNFHDPFSPYITSGVYPGLPIKVGANCWLATSVTVLQGVSIGHGSVIGARSLVAEDIPPFSVAIGIPCKVVKRFNPIEMKWIPANEFTTNMEDLLPSEADYLAGLDSSSLADIEPSIIVSGSDFGPI